ncbi:hypothetical protein SDJN03_14031, partial [Cucurbita argyrosperma subsp. sororia]
MVSAVVGGLRDGLDGFVYTERSCGTRASRGDVFLRTFYYGYAETFAKQLQLPRLLPATATAPNGKGLQRFDTDPTSLLSLSFSQAMVRELLSFQEKKVDSRRIGKFLKDYQALLHSNGCDGFFFPLGLFIFVGKQDGGFTYGF